jgi:hypothetical protein
MASPRWRMSRGAGQTSRPVNRTTFVSSADQRARLGKPSDQRRCLPKFAGACCRIQSWRAGSVPAEDPFTTQRYVRRNDVFPHRSPRPGCPQKHGGYDPLVPQRRPGSASCARPVTCSALGFPLMLSADAPQEIPELSGSCASVSWTWSARRVFDGETAGVDEVLLLIKQTT